MKLEDMFNREGKAVDDLMNVAKVVYQLLLNWCPFACTNSYNL